jgi:hypothetical protein
MGSILLWRTIGAKEKNALVGSETAEFKFRVSFFFLVHDVANER